MIRVRRELAATADQGAIAGAQALDMASNGRLGAEAAGIVLDADQVAAVVGGYPAPAVAAGQHDGLRIGGAR